MADVDALRRRTVVAPALAPEIANDEPVLKPVAQSTKSVSAAPPTKTARSVARQALRAFLLSLAFGCAVFQAYGFLSTRKADVTPQDNASATKASGPFDFPNPVFSADVEKRDAVKQAFLHSWHAYERDAWGADDYHPISKRGDNISESGGIGYTIVDTLDTLLIMGLDEEYDRARTWVQDELTFDVDVEFNAFEITIRLLGGLLSAYHLSPFDDRTLYLAHAVDLGNRLLATYKTPFGFPLSKVNLGQAVGIPDKDNRGLVSLAEVASTQLELKYLSEISGDDRYWKAAEHVMYAIRDQPNFDGLRPIFIDPNTGNFVASEIRLGSRGDSYYEYLIKQYLQTDATEPIYREMYDEAMSGIKNKLVQRTRKSGMVYTAELAFQLRGEKQGWNLSPKQDHLVCFLGGSLLLGVTEARLSVPPSPKDFSKADLEDWYVGTGLIDTCVETYNTATGLAPEIAFFYPDTDPRSETSDWYIKESTENRPLIDARNILRPETVESLFLAFRLTGDPKYREQGWKIFQAFEKHCKVETGGYVSILDVNQLPVETEDRMETFWLAETLKYLYLLFSDASVIPLTDYVFNTEAHLMPVFTPTVVDSTQL